jgi:DNA-binding SARP family transcriptional activator
VVNGNPLSFSGKPPQKPLALLKAILAQGNRQVSQTYLADTLWPDTEGDASGNALKKNLQRLRRLMVVKDAIILADGQLSINDKKCWIDFHPFEKIIDTIESILKTNRKWQKSGINSPDTDSLLLLAEKACRLYQGPFLSNVTPEPWTVGMTDRLQQRMLRMILWIGKILEDSDRLDEAVEWYLKGLEVDSRPEEYYQRLMICYNRLGRRTEALILYDRCKENLDASFGITPSDATKELYFSIRDDSSV